MSFWQPLHESSRVVLEYLLTRSVTGAIVFLLVLLVWALVRRSASAHVGSAWFLLPLVALAFPVEQWIPSPWRGWGPPEPSLIKLTSQSRGAAGLISRTGVESHQSTFRPSSTEASEAALDVSSPSLSVSAAEYESPERGEVGRTTVAPGGATVDLLAELGPPVLALSWLMVVLYGLRRFLAAQLSVLRLLGRSRALSCESLAIPGLDVEALARRAGVRLERGRLRVFESDEIDSPATWGLGRPVLLLPTGLSSRLGVGELRWVLLHEFAHLARRDHLIEIGQQLVQVMFFFHPAAWFSNRMVRAQRELACDEAALARCAPRERRAGAAALLEVAAHASGLASVRLSEARHVTVSLLNSKELLRNRIMRLNQIATGRPSWGIKPLSMMPLFVGALAAIAPAQLAVSGESFLPRSTVLEQTTYIFDSVGVEPERQAPELLEVEAAPQATLHKAPEREPVLTATDLASEVRAEVRESVEAGLQWLMEHQAADGGWHNQKHRLSGIQQVEPYFNDVAVTALAVRALHQANLEDPEQQKCCQQSVRRGADYLLAQQSEEGCYGARAGFVFLVGHPLATETLALLAMANEARGDLKRAEELRVSLQRAVSFIEISRNPYGGWRYDSPPAGDNDTLQTGRMLLALSAAFDAGVHASPECFAGGLSLMAELRDARTGRTGYQSGDDFAARIAGRHDDFPARLAEAPTAVHVRLLMDAPELDIRTAHHAQGVLLDRVPVWSRALGTTDFNYWMHGTLAMNASGGIAARFWNDALVRELLEHQERTGKQRGSWPCSDAWSAPGMEAFATASNTLSLQAVLN